jgi:adenine-specific DNA-methyltransferase
VFASVRASSLGKRFYLGKMDYFYFFFHLGLDLLREGGSLAFITTNYFVTATYARKLVQDIKERSTVLRLINFGETRIFESAAGQHNMITLLGKGKSEAVARTSLVKGSVKGKVSSEVLVSILEGTSNDVDNFEILQPNLYAGATISLSNSSQNPIEVVLEKLRGPGTKLNSVVTINQGIVSGADKVTNSHVQKFGYSQNDLGAGIFILSDEELQSLNLSEHELEIVKPFFKNSDVAKYWTKSETLRSIIYADKRDGSLETRPVLRAHLAKYEEAVGFGNVNAPYLNWPRSIDFEGQKIVAPQRSRTNTFGFSAGPWYASADIYYLTPPDEPLIPTKALLGILNSLPIFCWLYFRGKRKGAMLELYQVPLGEIPMPALTSANEPKFEELAGVVDTAVARRLESPAADISDTESAIDLAVAGLYGLTESDLTVLKDWIDGG